MKKIEISVALAAAVFAIVFGFQNCTGAGSAASNNSATLASSNVCSPGNLQSCSGNNGSGMQACNSNGTSYGICQLTTCNSGFNLSNGICVSDACTPNATQSCSANNGTGTQICTSNGSSWGACQITVCNSGYALVNGACEAITSLPVKAIVPGMGLVMTSTCPSGDTADPCNNQYAYVEFYLYSNLSSNSVAVHNCRTSYNGFFYEAIFVSCQAGWADEGIAGYVSTLQIPNSVEILECTLGVSSLQQLVTKTQFGGYTSCTSLGWGPPQ